MNELLKQFDGVKSFTTEWSWKTALWLANLLNPLTWHCLKICGCLFFKRAVAFCNNKLAFDHLFDIITQDI
jgi:hypothetical protein